MKKTIAVSFGLAAVLAGAAHSELSTDQRAAFQQKFALCVNQNQTGVYCDGFRDGLIYVREYGLISSQETSHILLQPVEGSQLETAPDLPQGAILGASPGVTTGVVVDPKASMTPDLQIVPSLPIQNIFPRIEMP